MRLAKFISAAGYCSRRQASRLIEQNQVIVNGDIADHIRFISRVDTVTVAGTPLNWPQESVYYLYHKPVGIDCNSDKNNPQSIAHIIEKIGQGTHLFAVGRLDKDSHGLLIITNDGDLCHKLLSPDYNHPKTYQVKVKPSYRNLQQGRECIDSQYIEHLERGVIIDGQMTLPCRIEQTGQNQYTIILHQGLNRQIRKMAQSEGFIVVDLKRISIAGLSIEGIKPGGYRRINSIEQQKISIK
ncbi:pseudouridine synthase [Psychrobium sp. 1_MG-2023]|uniref:pseudouridine synthase n=1 Tax=Psychrobium sp. 1_MG-2023 TaxID=3062624 RepID=UPI000C328D79|nr:pseudouridine synthase [Psychrobium sp. 1_MG-2023]MDP2560193.1 pseudouridine synthase [Psychrobium sp. 1_MG-2023]PKF57004.1 23S rRNA pseudouridine synthase F [Alteromonadales bacterium alter-6D02]